MNSGWLERLVESARAVAAAPVGWRRPRNSQLSDIGCDAGLSVRLRLFASRWFWVALIITPFLRAAR